MSASVRALDLRVADDGSGEGRSNWNMYCVEFRIGDVTVGGFMASKSSLRRRVRLRYVGRRLVLYTCHVFGAILRT